MESEEASINLRESSNALEMASGNNDDGDIRVDDISKNSGKRKHTSESWNHFKRVYIEDIQFAECNYCKARLKAPSSHGTTHLKKNFEKTCRNRPKKMDIRQSLMMASKKTSGVQEFTTHIFNQEDSRHKLDVMVILHDYALGIVDHEGFRDFVKCYKLLGKLNCRVVITTDMWTANNTKKGFMVVTGHFIDDSWTLQSVILRFIYIPALHTAEILADKLVECFLVGTLTANCQQSQLIIARPMMPCCIFS